MQVVSQRNPNAGFPVTCTRYIFFQPKVGVFLRNPGGGVQPAGWEKLLVGGWVGGWHQQPRMLGGLPRPPSLRWGRRGRRVLRLRLLLRLQARHLELVDRRVRLAPLVRCTQGVLDNLTSPLVKNGTNTWVTSGGVLGHEGSIKAPGCCTTPQELKENCALGPDWRTLLCHFVMGCNLEMPGFQNNVPSAQLLFFNAFFEISDLESNLPSAHWCLSS